MVATIAVMPNISELPALALLLLAVTVPSAYVAIGGPQLSYVGLQIVIAFVIVGVAEQPLTDVHVALLRVFATLLGTATLLVAFRLVGPDYAGRQLVARFAEVVRDMLAFLPPRGGVSLAPGQVVVVHRRIVASLPDILRLADEARAEAFTGGVDTEAAIAAGGRAVRIAYRLAAVNSGRSAGPWPPLPESVQRSAQNVDSAIRARLESALSMLEARHTMARPGSPRYREACAAAAAVASRPRPDLYGPLITLQRAADASRFTELAQWPPAAHGALVAEIEHAGRVVELLPWFEEHLRQMILPRDESVPPQADRAS
jgi:Fusaric acid resistance protein family